MVQPKKEVLIAVPIVGFVWGSLFGRKVLPMPVQDALFMLVLLLGSLMIVASWFCWSIVRNDEDVARWRKAVALIGVTANTLVVAIPFVGLPMTDRQLIIPTCLVGSFCGFVAGILAPREVRLPTALAGLTIASIILAIPIGV